MPGHGGDEPGVGLVAGQAELLDVGVLGAEHVPGTEAEELQDVADLGFGERILDVVAVTVRDALLVQQGDRLAAGASGAATDEVDHGILLSVDEQRRTRRLEAPSIDRETPAGPDLETVFLAPIYERT